MTRDGRHRGILGFRARLAVVAALLLVSACGPAPSPTGTAPGGTTGPTPPSPSPTPVGSGVAPSAEPSPAGTTVRAYLILGFGRQTGLVPVLRAVEAADAGPEAALAAVLGGPNDVERAAGRPIYTAIPPGTRLLGISREGSVATVDLSGEFDAATEDELASSYRVAQIVWTVTQFPDVDAVRIAIDGSVVTVVGPDRFALDRPLNRLDVTDALPPLFVDEPAWGATITSPLRIAGLANAFEATFQVRIADAEGRGLAAGPIMATCGTGCWGTFDESVPFAVQAAAQGTLQVYELSPRDGSPDNLREYPVWMSP